MGAAGPGSQRLCELMQEGAAPARLPFPPFFPPHVLPRTGFCPTVAPSAVRRPPAPTGTAPPGDIGSTRGTRPRSSAGDECFLPPPHGADERPYLSQGRRELQRGAGAHPASSPPYWGEAAEAETTALPAPASSAAHQAPRNH